MKRTEKGIKPSANIITKIKCGPDSGISPINAPDHIAAIKQLAQRYSYVDTTRVGIFGHSAGGYDAAHALLTHGDFYQVGISLSGNHDQRMDKAWWPECYMGYPIGKFYEEQSNMTLAKNLKGKLFLIHGEMDNNVNPASTFRFTGELIKANKDFDLLIVPNYHHGIVNHPYVLRRIWDYFTRYLLKVEPPQYEFRAYGKECFLPYLGRFSGERLLRYKMLPAKV